MHYSVDSAIGSVAMSNAAPVGLGKAWGIWTAACFGILFAAATVKSEVC